MNFLDMRTLMISVLATDALCTWVVFSLWRNNRKRFAGTSFWVADYGLQTVAVLLLILRGVLPPGVSVALVNPLAILGALFGFLGLERFVGKPTRQAYNYILFSAFFFVNTYFSWIQPELSLRNLILSLGLLTFFLQCTWLLFHRVPVEMRRMTRDVGIVFGLFSLASLVRIIFVLVSPSPENDFFKSGLFDSLILMSYQLLLILLAYNLSLMVNRRLLMELQSQEEKFNKAFRSSPYALMLTRLSDGRIIEVNDNFVVTTGYQPAEVLGKTTLELHLWVREEDRSILVKVLSEYGRMQGREFPFRVKSGEILTGLISAEIIRINQEPFILSSIEDITARKKAEEGLRESEERYRQVVENANEAILVAQDGLIKYYNPKAIELSGYSETDLPGMSFIEFVHPEDRGLVLERYQKRLAGETLPEVYPFRIIVKDGRVKWVEINSVVMSWEGKPATLVFLSEITGRKEMEEQLQKLSLMDDLTGLYNRRGFLTLAQQQIKVAERNKKEMFLFFTDQDNLKSINDTFGHQEGDRALIQISDILKETFRESDILSRMGGDEFAMLTIESTGLDPEVIRARLRNKLAEFNQKGTKPYPLSLSVGLARYHPDLSFSIDQLLAEADRAMYEEKKRKMPFKYNKAPPFSGKRPEAVKMNKSGMVNASKWTLIGLFCAIALVLMAGGYWFYRHEAEAIRIHQYGDLKGIADLKINQILRWRNERMADARLNSSAPFLRSSVIQWIRTPNDKLLESRIKDRLQLLKDAEGYDNVILTDSTGRILLSLNPRLTHFEPENKQLITKATSARQVVFGDFFRCSTCKQVHIDVAAPILDPAQKPVAVLVLRTDPKDYLYPLIQTWPTKSQSAETLLIRKDGPDALFLNSLRHRADPALTLRIPLSRADIPAAQAVQGKTGIFEGFDYRGIKVLSDIRPIPGTLWFMVAKVDREEILSEAAERARLIALLTLVLVVLSGFGTAFFYKHQGKRTFQALYRAEHEKAELLEQARVTLYSIGDAVITTDADGRVRQMNPVAETLTGWKEAEAQGKPLSEVFQIIHEETRQKVENTVDRILREGQIVGLANHTLLIAKDGTEYPIADSGAPIRNEAGEITGVVLVFRDQTEERKKIKELMESEERVGKEKYLSEAILNSLPGIFYLFDDKGHFLRWNKNFEWVTGRSANQITHIHPLDLFAGEEADRVAQRIQEVFEKGASEVVAHLVSKNGKRTAYHFTGLRVVLDGRICLIGIGLDITALKQAEEALRESEILFRTFSEKAPLGISFIDVDGRYEYVNPAFIGIFGWDLSDISTGRDWFKLAFPDPDYRRQVVAAWKEDLSRYKAEEARPRTYEVRSKSGDRKTVLFKPVTLISGKQFIIYEDITEYRQAEKALQESEEIFRRFMEHSPIYVFFKDENIRALRLSKNYETMLGKPIVELLGKNMDELFPSELAKSMVADDMRILKEGEVITIEEELNGRFYSTIKFPISIEGKPRYLAGFTMDITERKRTEEALLALSAQQEALLSAIPDIIMEVDENKVYTWANQTGYEFFGDEVIGREAALYFEGEQETYHIVQPLFNGQEDVIYLESWQRRKDGQKRLLAWWCRVLKDEKGNVRGALSSARDITAHRQAEEKVIEGAEKLKKAIEGIIQAMAATVEVKDPYTAGHQRRVADLARDIAKDLGFSDDEIEGIHMAGMIHDLGKLSVPAEILSKPTQLTEIEFSLIKVHPQAGFDILKEIDFPWPIARIVFQHHERINGSGYPLQIKDKEILPEAKVLAVADVVEAMASHRPYRPALGIDKALEEIIKNKGVLYDPEVVEVCLKLFRENHYELK